jgi:hypothetical protein
MASIYLEDIMFDPKAQIVGGSTKAWMKAAAPHRKRAQLLWEGTRQAFFDRLKAAKSALELIQAQEHRIWEGMGLCMHINKKEPQEGYKKWVDDQVEKYGSRQLIPWTFNRCLADETDKIVTGLEADNKHKHELLEYEEQYNAKHQQAKADLPPVEEEEVVVEDVDEEEEDSTKDQEHMKKFLEAVERAEQDMSGATKKKRKNRKKKKKTTVASAEVAVTAE